MGKFDKKNNNAAKLKKVIKPVQTKPKFNNQKNVSKNFVKTVKKAESKVEKIQIAKEVVEGPAKIAKKKISRDLDVSEDDIDESEKELSECDSEDSEASSDEDNEADKMMIGNDEEESSSEEDNESSSEEDNEAPSEEDDEASSEKNNEVDNTMIGNDEEEASSEEDNEADKMMIGNDEEESSSEEDNEASSEEEIEAMVESFEGEEASLDKPGDMSLALYEGKRTGEEVGKVTKITKKKSLVIRELKDGEDMNSVEFENESDEEEESSDEETEAFYLNEYDIDNYILDSSEFDEEESSEEVPELIYLNDSIEDEEGEFVFTVCDRNEADDEESSEEEDKIMIAASECSYDSEDNSEDDKNDFTIAENPEIVDFLAEMDQRKNHISNYSVYLVNIAAAAEESAIIAGLKGQLNVNIVKNKKGNRGYGYIVFGTVQKAEDAIKVLNGREIKNKKISATIFSPKTVFNNFQCVDLSKLLINSLDKIDISAQLKKYFGKMCVVVKKHNYIYEASFKRKTDAMKFFQKKSDVVDGVSVLFNFVYNIKTNFHNTALHVAATEADVAKVGKKRVRSDSSEIEIPVKKRKINEKVSENQTKKQNKKKPFKFNGKKNFKKNQ